LIDKVFKLSPRAVEELGPLLFLEFGLRGALTSHHGEDCETFRRRRSGTAPFSG
jgi:hypothetical protein